MDMDMDMDMDMTNLVKDDLRALRVLRMTSFHNSAIRLQMSLLSQSARTETMYEQVQS